MRLVKYIYNFFSFFNYHYFPTTLNREPKTNSLKGYQVDFSPEETEFLKLSAATFNYVTDYTNGYWQKHLYACTLQNVTLLGNTGAIVKENKVISESAFDQVRLCISPAYRSPAFMWKHRKKGLYTSIFHLPWAQTSNFHWFYDSLPRLYTLLQLIKEPINLVVNKDIPAFQLETLQFIIKDNPNFSLTYISKHKKWKIEKYVFPSFVTNHSSGYLPPELGKFFRNKIWQGYQVQEQTPKTRIYISRSKARKRRVINEEAVIQALTANGFQVVYAEDLTYKQQVQVFYNAALVIAPHGAGLTNILFSKECHVVELHPADIIKPHYFLAAKALSFNYTYVIGSNSDNNLDFSIDIYQLLEKIKEI